MWCRRHWWMVAGALSAGACIALLIAPFALGRTGALAGQRGNVAAIVDKWGVMLILSSVPVSLERSGTGWGFTFNRSVMDLFERRTFIPGVKCVDITSPAPLRIGPPGPALSARAITIRAWLPTAATGAVAALCFWRAARRRYRGGCASCGYELGGLPRCPECGGEALRTATCPTSAPA